VFLGPARNGLSDQIMVTPGSSAIAASVRPASASSSPRPRAIGGGAGAGALTAHVFFAFALFAGACSVRRASQHKLHPCTVACKAAELSTPVLFQPRTFVVEELKPTPATVAPPTVIAQITEPLTAVCRATMVGGARCIARRARHRSTADRAAASRAARRAVGSRLQAASRLQEGPPLTFDASRQRLKIQAGLLLANRVLTGRMNEIRLPAGSAGKLNGRFSSVLYVQRLHRFQRT